MRIRALMSLLATAVCLSVFAATANFPINAKPWENSSQDLKVVNICNLIDQDLNEIMQGFHPEVAVEFSAHTVLPISFFLKGDLINLVENEGNFGRVEIKQTFYVRCVQEELIFSFNLIEWKPFLEFVNGKASVSLSVQNGQPSIVFGAETHRNN